MFWIAMIGLALVALAFLFGPVVFAMRNEPGAAVPDSTKTGSVSSEPIAEQAADISVYKDQLNELENDLARGLIDPQDAEAARIEIARRILTAGSAGNDSERAAGAALAPMVLAASIAGFVMIASVVVYLQVGSPGVPGVTFAERQGQPEADHRVEVLVAKVEERLRAHPEDGQGWDVIAPVYMRQRRFDDAAQAFANAARLLGEDYKRLVGFGEARVLADEGLVAELARKAFRRAAALKPDSVQPRFWLAVAEEQDGNLQPARAAFISIEESSPADAPWLPLVRLRISAINAQLGIDDTADGTAATAALDSSDDQLPRGPDSTDIAAAQQLSPEDRQQMIAQMVTGLAERLAENPDDLSGWLMLIRSYKVLGRDGQAAKSLKEAFGQFSGRPDAQEKISALAAELGMTQQ